MKIVLLSLLAALLLAPLGAGAAPLRHDFSSQFKRCYAAADADNAAKDACLEEELNGQSKALADSQEATLQLLAGAEKQEFSDDFLSWKKTILLDCSILSDSKTVPLERENVRKYCLIERTIGRLNTDEEMRQAASK
ncbi:hypothetical protein AAKU55_004136 [Oxalobacteraceae bacterium GrIS 1.11]